MLILFDAKFKVVHSAPLERVLLPRGLSRGPIRSPRSGHFGSPARLVSRVLRIRAILGKMDFVLDGVSG